MLHVMKEETVLHKGEKKQASEEKGRLTTIRLIWEERGDPEFKVHQTWEKRIKESKIFFRLSCRCWTTDMQTHGTMNIRLDYHVLISLFGKTLDALRSKSVTAEKWED